MNKFIVAMFVTVLSSSAMAKTVPVPPKRPASLTTPAPLFVADPNLYGAVVKDGQVIVRAPLGSDVDVDVDGNSFSIDVDHKNPWDRFLPWKW